MLFVIIDAPKSAPKSLRLIRQHLRFMVENLNINGSSLIDYLIQCKLLTDTERGTIECSKLTTLEKCERLLVILSAKRTKLFHDEVNKDNLGCKHIQLLLGTSTTTSLKFN